MSIDVLVLDDSLTVRMDLAAALEAAEFRPHLCANLAEARRTLDVAPIQVIILDVMLPDGDGVEFLRELRSAPETRKITVLMLSGEADVADRIRGLQMGADEYIGKPYDTGCLIARICELAKVAKRSTADAVAVLVIDDSETFRASLREALESKGHEVLEADSGEEGLRMAANRRPGVIIVDGILPGIDGATVIRRVRLDAALRNVPCMLLTASGDRRSELRALEAGADAFVCKSEDVGVILAKLGAALRHPFPAAEYAQASSLLGPKRILAVDDSATYLSALAETLREEGYDVVTAHSGQEALELIAVQPVDCILLDLLMPGLDGEATCQRIKSTSMFRDLPVILLTALEDRGVMIQGLSAGADDYIPKSADWEIVKARVRAQLRRKQFEDENRRYRERLLEKEFEAAEARAARELAETKAALVEELELKNRELESFSYSVSHDLRAPLRGIDGFSLALLDDYGHLLDDTGKDYLRRVRAAAQRMGELIDDLLQLSRVNRSELSRSRVALSDLVLEIRDSLVHREPERIVRFVVAPDVFVEADEHLVRVLLENLLGNAWKFTSKKSEAVIEFGALGDSNGASTYFIKDNGAGFKMEYADRLFAPFQRMHSESEFPGTGIGLATVMRVVRRHGGRAWAESQENQGTTIYFSLSRGFAGDRG